MYDLSKDLPIITILETVEQEYKEKDLLRTPSDMMQDIATMLRGYFKGTDLNITIDNTSIDIEGIGTISIRKTRTRLRAYGTYLYMINYIDIPTYIYNKNLSPQQAHDIVDEQKNGHRIEKRKELLALARKLVDGGFDSDLYPIVSILKDNWGTVESYMKQIEKGESNHE